LLRNFSFSGPTLAAHLSFLFSFVFTPKVLTNSKIESPSKYPTIADTKSEYSSVNSLFGEPNEDSKYDDEIDEELELRIAQLDRYEKMLQECLDTLNNAEKAVIVQHAGARPPISLYGIKEILEPSDSDGIDNWH
jgi:hypothetical protein